MYKIIIKDLKLYGKHGVYQQEKLLDAPFQINVTCSLFAKSIVTKLTDTVNYENVYTIIKELFATPHDLLETLASNIIEVIKDQHKMVEKVSIEIIKLNPPIEGMQGKVGVCLEL